MATPSNRQIALANGNLFYEGTPCTKGHGTKRRAKNGCCVVCESERQKAKNSQKTCISCGTVFSGRPRFKTCSDKCSEQRRNETRLRHAKSKYQTPEGKVEACLRQRINKVLRRSNSRKTSSFVDLTGVTTANLRKHVESLFLPGMDWNNHGQWHLDHIRPCASFDLTNSDQQCECFHYSNLQPLWAEDNLSKADKWVAS